MSLKGKKVVFTGKLSKTRAKMKAEAEAAGIDVDTAISGNTDILVCGPQVAHNATNSKHKKAKKLGVEILEESAYRLRLTGKAPAKKKTEDTTKVSNKNKSEKTKTKKKETSTIQTLSSWFNTQTKSDLRAILNDIGDDQHRSSWSKARLIEQLENASTESVFNQLSDAQVTSALGHMGKEIKGTKSAQKEQLRALLNIKSDRSSKILTMIFSEDESIVNQGFSLFESLGDTDQESLLKQFPMKTTRGLTQWDNKNKHKELEDDQIPSGLKNHIVNIGFVLHALAEHEKLKTIKKAELWISQPFNEDFLSLLKNLSSIKNLNFRVAEQESFTIQADTLLSELKALKRSKALSIRYLPLVETLPEVKTLTLNGEENEPKPKFSELLLKCEESEYGFDWQTRYTTQRAYCSITDKRFPKLQKLTITNPSILGHLTINSTVLKSLTIENPKSLCSLKVNSTLENLHISDAPELRRMNINTTALKRYTLSPGLPKDISGPVDLRGQAKIEAHLTSQNDHFLHVVKDSTYGFNFTGSHAHLTHHETWVETYHYESSFSYFIDYLKQNLRQAAGEKDIEVNNFGSDDRCELWSEEFYLDNTCTTACGYEMDFYETASWKNRAVNTLPEVNCKRPRYDHTNSPLYPVLKDIIEDELMNDFYAVKLIELISPNEFKELTNLHQQLNQ